MATAVQEWIEGMVGALREAAERVFAPQQRVPVMIPVPVRSPRPRR